MYNSNLYILIPAHMYIYRSREDERKSETKKNKKYSYLLLNTNGTRTGLGDYT